MTRSTTQPPTARALWVGVLASPIIWGIYFMGGYALSEAVCRANFFGGTLLQFQALTASLLLMTVIALLGIVYAGWITYQHWQQLQVNKVPDNVSSHFQEYGSFMALVGLLLSGLTALITLVMGISVLFMPTCS